MMQKGSGEKLEGKHTLRPKSAKRSPSLDKWSHDDLIDMNSVDKNDPHHIELQPEILNESFSPERQPKTPKVERRDEMV